MGSAMKKYARDRKGRRGVQRTPGSAIDSPLACFTRGSNVEEVRLSGEGEEAKITGRWIPDEELERIDGEEGKLFLIQRFLNWRNDPASILSFTRKHGPLLSLTPSAGGIFFSPTPTKGKRFEFMLEGGGYGWRDLQRRMREHWETYIPIQHRRNHPTIPGPSQPKGQAPTHLAQTFTKPLAGWNVTTEQGEKFHYLNGRLEFETLNLARLFDLNLLSLAATGMLRKCYAENCANPYFTTTDAKRFYCDDPCAASVQPEHKRRSREKKKKERMKVQERIPRRTTHRPTKKSPTRRKKRRREKPATNPSLAPKT